MKKYNSPMIDVLLFDEEEDILTASTATAEYAARQLNRYMYDKTGVSSTTTIKIQDVNVTGIEPTN